MIKILSAGALALAIGVMANSAWAGQAEATCGRSYAPGTPPFTECVYQATRAALLSDPDVVNAPFRGYATTGPQAECARRGYRENAPGWYECIAYVVALADQAAQQAQAQAAQASVGNFVEGLAKVAIAAAVIGAASQPQPQIQQWPVIIPPSYDTGRRTCVVISANALSCH